MTTAHEVALWRRACQAKHRAASRLWLSVHEPRVITAIFVAWYAAAVVCGWGMVLHSVPTILPEPVDTMEGVIMVTGGLLGIPAAWSGRWWAERGALACLTLVGVILLGMTALAMAGDVHPLDVHLDPEPTASWIFGVVSWVVIAALRWCLGVGLWPYAPDKGPLPIDAREALALARIERQNQELRERVG